MKPVRLSQVAQAPRVRLATRERQGSPAHRELLGQQVLRCGTITRSPNHHVAEHAAEAMVFAGVSLSGYLGLQLAPCLRPVCSYCTQLRAVVSAHCGVSICGLHEC